LILLWHYYWPVAALGLLLGLLGGLRLFGLLGRAHAGRTGMLGLWTVPALLFVVLWHGPLGAGERLAGHMERDSNALLRHFEMAQVTARVERAPLARRVLLAGPADDFQQAELVRMLPDVPGVSSARWTTPPVKAPGR
jgi:hypothetical protein